MEAEEVARLRLCGKMGLINHPFGLAPRWRFRSEAEKSSLNIHRSYRSVCARLKEAREVVVLVDVEFAALAFLLHALCKETEEEREKHF